MVGLRGRAPAAKWDGTTGRLKLCAVRLAGPNCPNAAHRDCLGLNEARVGVVSPRQSLPYVRAGDARRRYRRQVPTGEWYCESCANIDQARSCSCCQRRGGSGSRRRACECTRIRACTWTQAADAIAMKGPRCTAAVVVTTTFVWSCTASSPAKYMQHFHGPRTGCHGWLSQPVLCVGEQGRLVGWDAVC